MAAALSQIAASDLSSWTGILPGKERWSELATRDTVAPSSALSPRYRRWHVMVIVAVLAVLALGATYFVINFVSQRPVEPLRIAVLEPKIARGGNEEMDLAASGVLMAALSGLSSLEGVAPLDPQQAGSAASPVEAARAAAADEVLAATIQDQGTQEARV